MPHDAGSGSLEIINAYIACKQTDKADHIMASLAQKSEEYLTWYLSLSDFRFAASYREAQQAISILANIAGTYEKMSKENGTFSKKAEAMDDKLNTLYEAFVAKASSAGVLPQK